KRVMENLYYLIIVSAIIIEYLLTSISSVLDIKNITPIIPLDFKKAYDGEKYVRSQEYLKARTRFGLFSSTFSLGLILIVIHSDVFGYLDQYVRLQTENYILQGLLFIGIIYFFQDIISLPFSLYNTFVIEQKFGFNKIKPRLYFFDKIKGYGIFIVLGSTVITPLLYFFHVYSEIGWLIAWSVLTVFMIAIQPLFVHVIAPMFNKFTPLEEGDLRKEIEKYTSKVDFPLVRIDIMDGSKRSAHSNAYFTGFGKSRRIAIFDTLVEKHSTKEIVSVVAHEVGHYKLKHILQGTIIGIIETGIMLFAFNLIMNDISLFNVFGVNQLSVHAGIVFFSMVYAPVSMLTSIVTTAISRKNEFEADKFSLDTTSDGQALISMLIGLSANNLSHLTPHPMKVFLSYSHPPVIDRIKAVDQYL
ncbi:MAG: M48 family metallopeptidase, partial [Candidatus Marinimicrobia bacterium]|nr:M48 family metallopeptidase [Candidatus Neomarinimicrobiota bacterium]